MPRVYRFLSIPSIRSEVHRLAELGLHVGIDLEDPQSLFGPGWDREARDLGRMLRRNALKVVVRGPGWDLPLGTSDPFFADQLVAYHDRAIATASHLGAEDYLVRLGSFYGLSRSQRLARFEATGRMLEHLAGRTRTSGIRLVVQHHLEHELGILEHVAGQLEPLGGGLVISPARAACAKTTDLATFVERCAKVVVGMDLTDLKPEDLEPRLPGQGILGESPELLELLWREGIHYFVLESSGAPHDQLVAALNQLARAGSPNSDS